MEPVLSVADISSSMGAKSHRNYRVIPSWASCNISIRTVADQNSDHLITKLREILDQRFAVRQSCNTLRVEVIKSHPWWKGDPSSDLTEAAKTAVHHVWGTKPEIIREGGSMPIITYLQNTLKKPTIQIPLGQASDNAHLPNERIRTHNLVKVQRTS